jgi:hypothetical protein
MRKRLHDYEPRESFRPGFRENARTTRGTVTVRDSRASRGATAGRLQHAIRVGRDDDVGETTTPLLRAALQHRQLVTPLS